MLKLQLFTLVLRGHACPPLSGQAPCGTNLLVCSIPSSLGGELAQISCKPPAIPGCARTARQPWGGEAPALSNGPPMGRRSKLILWPL
jgi:hypothetical protein